MRTFVSNNLPSVVQVQVSHVPPIRFDLVPGTNLVDSEQWKRGKENPTIKRMLSATVERGLAPEAPTEKLGEPQLVEYDEVADAGTLAAIKDPKTRARILADTFDVRLLRIWLEEAKTEQGRVEILKQIDKLEGASKKRATATAA